MKITTLLIITLILNILIFGLYGFTMILHVYDSGLLNSSKIELGLLVALIPNIIAICIVCLCCVAFLGHKKVILTALSLALVGLFIALFTVLYLMLFKFSDDGFGMFHVVVLLIIMVPAIMNIKTLRQVLAVKKT